MKYKIQTRRKIPEEVSKTEIDLYTMKLAGRREQGDELGEDICTVKGK